MQAELILDAAIKYDIHMFEGHLAPAATHYRTSLDLLPRLESGRCGVFWFRPFVASSVRIPIECSTQTEHINNVRTNSETTTEIVLINI